MIPTLILLAAIVVIVVVLAAFFMTAGGILAAVFKSGTSFGNSARSAARNASTQLGEDGFWIESPDRTRAWIFNYYYWTNQVRHSGQGRIESGLTQRQFIYTGARPEQVEIRSMLQVDSDEMDSFHPSTDPNREWRDAAFLRSQTTGSSESSSQPPSAY